MSDKNPAFMVDENRVDPPVGEAGYIYTFYNAEDDKEYIVLWEHYHDRDKSQDYRFEARAKAARERIAQEEIDELNDLYKRS
mgnify:CR=1 FL=1